jgi:hypothetical protein
MMRLTRLATPWRVIVILSLGATMVLLNGCGGSDIDDDDGYDPGDPAYPQYKDLTLILRVVDPDGDPISGASVWVDDFKDDKTTDAQLHPLGEGYPRQWRGWLANWTSDDYRVVINYRGDTDEFLIEAGKTGYWADSTRVVISDYEPDEIFVRDVLVLVPKSGRLGPAQSEAEAQQAEIVPADEDFQRQAGNEPIHTLGDE